MGQMIKAFTVNEKEENSSVYWGEKVKLEWVIEPTDRAAQPADDGKELAVLYPRNWSIRDKTGSMEIAIYEDTEFILRMKDPKTGESEQKMIRVNVKEGRAEAEITVMLLDSQGGADPYAQLDIEYTNASYGYVNRGVGRVDTGSALLYPDTGQKVYRFVIPYRASGAVSCYSQEFELWME